MTTRNRSCFRVRSAGFTRQENEGQSAKRGGRRKTNEQTEKKETGCLDALAKPVKLLYTNIKDFNGLRICVFTWHVCFSDAFWGAAGAKKCQQRSSCWSIGTAQGLALCYAKHVWRFFQLSNNNHLPSPSASMEAVKLTPDQAELLKASQSTRPF